MDEFLITISRFPTAIYTTALVVVAGYWVLSFIGTFDLDALDADIEVEGHVGEIGQIASLISTLGLTGVPITIVISLLTLNAWIVCYFISLVLPAFPHWIFIIQVVVNIGIAIASFMMSILISAIMIKPLKGLFAKVNHIPISKSLLGVTCRVRSSRADKDFGEAECSHEGASLLIKVRTTGDQVFSTGALVIPIEHNFANNSFTIVSEEEFKQQLN